MNTDLSCDEDLLRRLPLPLAQLYRRALNAKSPLENHLAAFYFWEAGLKLLAIVALIEHAAESPPPTLPADQLAELQHLVRPSLGHWWRFVKIMVRRLGESETGHFAAINKLLLGRDRDDMPRTAGLETVLLEVLRGKVGSRATVNVASLFDHLVQLRNEELGHGAAGQRPRNYYNRLGPALLAGTAELFSRLDVRAGRRLVYIGDVHRQRSGGWLVERYELAGESPRRLESLEFPESATAQLPRPARVYLEPAVSAVAAASTGPDGCGSALVLEAGERDRWGFHGLYPLLTYDPESNESRFFNGFDHKSKRLTHLCYTNSATSKEVDSDCEFHRLLAQVLGKPIEPADFEGWTGAATPADATPSDGGDEPVSRIGDFELLSKLGWGGMGVVYRARQPTLGREVALKVLRQVGNPRAESRFAREIRALGQVEHPNLVKVFTSGADGDRWFYTMELVEGTTLDAVQIKLTSTGSRAGELDLHTWKQTFSVACADTRKAEVPLSGAFAKSRLAVASSAAKSATKSATNSAGSSPAGPAAGPAADSAADPSKGSQPARGEDSTDASQTCAGQAPESAAPSHRRNLALLTKHAKTSGADLATDRGYMRQMAELIRQVANAAHALHEAGVVHRDIKPGNIIVTENGERAVLMDLGLAQLTDEVEGRLTRTREFLGTPRYASPEQVLAAGRIDRRSDIYSLGATLWELLTLRPIYGATEQTPFADVARRIQIREPERVRKYSARVPRDLDAIVLKCLEKDPDRRYATAQELSADLEHFLRHELVAARPVGEFERAWRCCRRNPVVSSLLATVVVLLLVGLGGVVWKWRDAEMNLTRALTAEKMAEESRYAADVRLAVQAAEEGNLGRALHLLENHRLEPGKNDPRGFEWRYLWRLFQGDSLTTFHGDSKPLTSLAFAPDGATTAIGDTAGQLTLLDLQTQRKLNTTATEDLGISSIAFSRDGMLLAASTGNWEKIQQPGKVFLFDAKTLEPRGVFAGSTKAVNAVEFSPDRQLLAAATEGNGVLVWRLARGSAADPLVLSVRHTGVNCLRFSSDGELLAAGSGDGHLRIWNVAGLSSGSQTDPISDTLVHVSGIMSLRFLPGSKTIVAGTRDGPLLFWDATARRLVGRWESGQGVVQSIDCTPDGRTLVTAGSNCTIKTWNVAEMRESITLRGHTDIVSCVAVSPIGGLVASASRDATAKLWNPAKRSNEEIFSQDGAVPSIAFSPDGKFLAAACGARAEATAVDSSAMIWEASTGKLIGTLRGHAGPVLAVAFAPDGKTLLTGSLDSTAILWDAATRTKLCGLEGHSDGINAVAYSPRGDLAATASRDGTARLWKLEKAAAHCVATLRGHEGWVRGVAFSPDGAVLVTCSSDRTVRLWIVRTQQPIDVLSSGPATSVAFAPDGGTLAVGSKDRSVRLWKLDNHHHVTNRDNPAILEGYGSSILAVAFSPGGKTVAAGGQDSSVTLWNLPSNQEVAVFRPHSGAILSLIFAPDGNALASGSSDYTVRISQALGWEQINSASPVPETWSHP